MRLICRAYTCPVLLSPLLEYLAALRLITQPVTLLFERFSRPLCVSFVSLTLYPIRPEAGHRKSSPLC
jgi:hypothetical protein